MLNTIFTPFVPIPELKADIPVIIVDFKIENIEKVRLLYDLIEVWRSTDNITYTEITAQEDTPAFIDSTLVGPTWNLNGTQLIIEKNNAAPVIVNFTEANPYNLQQILDKINSYFPRPYVNIQNLFATQKPTNTNLIRLTSDVKGLESGLLISGSANSILGFSTTKAIGKTHRLHLTNPTIHYPFYDISADLQLNTSYYYKIRFRSTKTGRLSEFSQYVLGEPLQIVQDTNLVKGFIILANEHGFPEKDKRIIIELLKPTQIGTGPYVGIMEKRIEIKTDQFGYAETKLPKNVDIKVYIEDSLLNRVMNTGNVDFDILQKIINVNDPFNPINQPNLVPVVAIT